MPDLSQDTDQAITSLDSPEFQELFAPPVAAEPAPVAEAEPEPATAPSEEDQAAEEDISGEQEKTETESTPEPEEETDPEIDFDLIENEELREKFKAEYEKSQQVLTELDKLRSRNKELESGFGKQSAELGALRKQHAEAREKIDQDLKQMDTDFVQVLQNLDSNIAEANESGNTILKYQLEQQRDQHKSVYNNERYRKIKAFTDEVEGSFLNAKGNERFKDVKDKFDDFLVDLGLPIINVKADATMLAKYYNTLYDAERGKNIDSIIAKNKEHKIKQGAKIKQAQQPPAGSKKTETQPPKGGMPISWNVNVKRSGGVI